MRKLFILLFISAVTFQLSSCKTESKKVEDTPTVTKEVEDDYVEETTDGEREPTNDEIREFGIIKKIEDGQYPMFTVTVEFPERQTTADFSINIEALPQTDSDLFALKGKYATIYYTDESENMLMDIHFKGKTLYGEYAPELDDSYKSITGVLGGAVSESGDLPNTISITDADENKMEFKEFVTKEIIAKNEQTVTGYYYTRYKQEITYLKKSED